jgi:hypothetical protein
LIQERLNSAMHQLAPGDDQATDQGAADDSGDETRPTDLGAYWAQLVAVSREQP